MHVAVNPPEMLESSLVKKVAAIINNDFYQTRLLLSGRIPKLVAHLDSEEAVESILKKLSSLGLLAFAVDDSDLHNPLISMRVFKAHSLQFGEKQIEFLARNGSQKIFDGRDLYIILYGKMNIPILTKKTTTKMKLSVPSTVMTGGIPVWRRAEENVEHISLQTEYFIRLYGRVSLEPEIEISESSFDYAFLGTKKTPSSSENLRTLFSQLKKMFPDVIVDSKLTEGTPIIQGNELENTCKLIILCHHAESAIDR